MTEWVDALIAGMASLLVTALVALGIKERMDRIEQDAVTGDTCKAVKDDFTNRIEALRHLVERMDREEAEWRKLVSAKLDRLIER